MTAPARTTDIYKAMKPLIYLIRTGKFISVDPSIGSSSSMPAYAIYDRGELIHSAKLKINPSLSIYEKAQEIHRQVSSVYTRYRVDLLIYEEIPDQAYTVASKGGINHKGGWSGVNVSAHATLLKSLGVILGVPGPTYALGLRPVVWKRRARDTYRKGDIADAVELGWVALEMARDIEELENGNREISKQKNVSADIERVRSSRTRNDKIGYEDGDEV